MRPGSIPPASAISASSSRPRTISPRRSATPINTVEMIEDGVPAFRLVNTAIDGRYRITKTVFSDPVREVVLQQIHFEALVGALADYQLHAIVAPHLVNAGADNTGWCGDFKGHQMLFAEGPRPVARGGLVGAMARTLGRLCRRFRRLADAVARRRAAQRIPARRKRQCRACRHASTLPRSGGRARAGDRLRRAAGGSGLARAAQPAAAARRQRSNIYCEGWRQKQAALLPLDQHQREQGPQSLSRQHRRAGHASRRGLRRDHRQPVDPLGLCQGR